MKRAQAAVQGVIAAVALMGIAVTLGVAVRVFAWAAGIG